MNSNPNDMNITQFVEDVFGSVLKLQKVHYTPVGSYEKEITYENSYAVLYSFGCIYKDINQEYDQHVSDVVSALIANVKCEYYVSKVGKYLLSNAKFTWNHLRVFLSHMIALAAFAYKKGVIILSDDLLYTTANFMEEHFKEHIKNSGGWLAFQQDCVLYTVKEEESERTLKPGSSNKQIMKNPKITPKLSNVLLVHTPVYTSVLNQTFGLSHTTCDIQVHELNHIYASCAHDYNKLFMFSLLDPEGSHSDGACNLCNGAASKDKNFKVQNVIPKKQCSLAAHVIIISAWVLNEMHKFPAYDIKRIFV